MKIMRYLINLMWVIVCLLFLSNLGSDTPIREVITLLLYTAVYAGSRLLLNVVEEA